MTRSVVGRESNDLGKRRHAGTRRRGAIIVLFAILLVVFLAVLALSIDTGYMYTMQGELHRAVDAAALAGAGELNNGTEATRGRVVEYMVRNPVGEGGGATVAEGSLDSAMSQFTAEHQSDLEVELGHWRKDQADPLSGSLGVFEPTTESPSAVSVQMTYRDLPLFFAAALGHDEFDIQAKAIASYQPRDIMLVLDLSGSMNDDSELKSIPKLGREHIEANLKQIYEELSSPTFGNMTFPPDYFTAMGKPPANSSQAQVSVQYRYRSVYVKSTKPLKSIMLESSGRGNQKINNISGNEGLFSRRDGRPIHAVKVKSGSNNGAEPFNFQPNAINKTIAEALELDGIPYPYPSGSWYDYFDYVKKSSGANANAGYHYQFGYLNLVNYWLEVKCRHDQTPSLWMGSAEPITAVKSSVNQFMDYLEEVTTNDRAGLSVYNSASGEGKLEAGLSTDMEHVAYVARHRQAGHYHVYTNIGAGMHSARKELTDNGRDNAFKMMVVLTDGVANWKNGRYSISNGRQYVLNEAAAAAALGYPVMTISLGVGADTGLMQSVADLTDGLHFNIPGGRSADEYREGLREAFKEIAAHRPLRIVK